MEQNEKFTKSYEQRKQFLLMPVREMKQFVADTQWRPLDERGFNTIACGIEEANVSSLWGLRLAIPDVVMLTVWFLSKNRVHA